jgi:hypothetical protein
MEKVGDPHEFERGDLPGVSIEQDEAGAGASVRTSWEVPTDFGTRRDRVPRFFLHLAHLAVGFDLSGKGIGRVLDPRCVNSGIRDKIAMQRNRGARHDMTITIRLSDEEQRRLAERAARNGHNIAEYVHLLIERDIQKPATVDQALAPFRGQVAESGMTDDELGDFFEEVREEIWQEKHRRPSTTP